MSFGRTYQCPLERPLVSNRQRWGGSSGGSGDRAAVIPQNSGGEQKSGISIGSRRRSRSPCRHRGYSSALAVGPSARFRARGVQLHKPRSRAQPGTVDDEPTVSFEGDCDVPARQRHQSCREPFACDSFGDAVELSRLLFHVSPAFPVSGLLSPLVVCRLFVFVLCLLFSTFSTFQKGEVTAHAN